MPGDASTAQLEEGDWQPPNVQRPAHGVANNGAVLDKSPPDPPRSQHPHGASTAQQAACLDASKQRKQLVNRLALQTGPEHSAAERVVPGPGRWDCLPHAVEASPMCFLPRGSSVQKVQQVSAWKISPQMKIWMDLHMHACISVYATP